MRMCAYVTDAGCVHKCVYECMIVCVYACTYLMHYPHMNTKGDFYIAEIHFSSIYNYMAINFT